MQNQNQATLVVGRFLERNSIPVTVGAVLTELRKWKLLKLSFFGLMLGVAIVWGISFGIDLDGRTEWFGLWTIVGALWSVILAYQFWGACLSPKTREAREASRRLLAVRRQFMRFFRKGLHGYRGMNPLSGSMPNTAWLEHQVEQMLAQYLGQHVLYWEKKEDDQKKSQGKKRFNPRYDIAVQIVKVPDQRRLHELGGIYVPKD